MNKKMILAGAALALLTACGGSGQPGSLELRQIADLEARVAALEGSNVSDSLTDVESRLTALEAEVATLEDTAGEGAHGEAGVFELAVAQYVMDTAGFHGMDEGLNETQTVDPAYLSAVNRVLKVVGATPWPEDLHEQVEAFETVLADFAAALEADDGAAAAGLATSVHDAQHDLSHAIDGLLGGGGHDH